MAPTSVNFTGSAVQTMSIGFTDPYGMTPSFILLPNIGTPKCWAFPPMRDLQIEGIAKIKIDATNGRDDAGGCVGAGADGGHADARRADANHADRRTADGDHGDAGGLMVPAAARRRGARQRRRWEQWRRWRREQRRRRRWHRRVRRQQRRRLHVQRQQPSAVHDAAVVLQQQRRVRHLRPELHEPNRLWGPCYASACTSQVNAAVSFCCPPAP